MVLWFLSRFFLNLGCSLGSFLLFLVLTSLLRLSHLISLLIIQQSLVYTQMYGLFVGMICLVGVRHFMMMVRMGHFVKISDVHLGSTAAEAVKGVVVRVGSYDPGEKDSD